MSNTCIIGLCFALTNYYSCNTWMHVFLAKLLHALIFITMQYTDLICRQWKRSELLRKGTNVLYAVVATPLKLLYGMVVISARLGFTANACLWKTGPPPICPWCITLTTNAICVYAKLWWRQHCALCATKASTVFYRNGLNAATAKGVIIAAACPMINGLLLRIAFSLIIGSVQAAL